MDLEYDIAYHLKSRINLKSGRQVMLEGLDQRMVYAGLLMGVPDSSLNDEFVVAAMKLAESRCSGGTKPHLIAPLRRDFRRVPGDMEKMGRSPVRIPQWLPMVACIGTFQTTVVRDETFFWSTVVLVWFQDEYAPPILIPEVADFLDSNWDSVATEVEM